MLSFHQNETEAKIDWQEGLAFQAHLDGHEFIIDGTPEAGGKNLGPRPKGLTLVSLPAAPAWTSSPSWAR